MSADAYVMPPAEGGWKYGINYGPDGEANYANVYDAAGALVGNLKTHHAIKVVDAVNRHDAPAEATSPAATLAEVTRQRDEAVKALRPFAALQVPTKPQGSAGFYSLRFADIDTARTILARARESS